MPVELELFARPTTWLRDANGEAAAAALLARHDDAAVLRYRMLRRTGESTLIFDEGDVEALDRHW